MPIMTAKELSAFGARAGSISKITDREATGDRSVTLDRHDKLVLFSRIPPEKYARKGGALPNGNPDLHEFLVAAHDTARGFQQRLVPVKYPKKQGNELRLYGSGKTGLDFRAGDYFYIIVRDDEPIPFIGTLSPAGYTNLLKSVNKFPSFAEATTFDDEEEDAAYQQAIANKAAGLPVTFSGTRYPRSAEVALRALENAVFQCECSTEDKAHDTFVSAATGQAYVEAHHLVPLSKQSGYEASLDIVENIVALCPNCHRRFHHGAPEHRIECLLVLLEKRKSLLMKKRIDIDEAGLMSAYGIEMSDLFKHFATLRAPTVTAGNAIASHSTPA